MVVPLVLIGLAAGFLGGMLGIGGSIVMIPAMTEILGPNQHLYQAAAMIVNFFVVAPAVYQHRRAGAVASRSVMRMLPLGLVGVTAGVIISELRIFAGEGEAYLRLIFGMFLLSLSVLDLYRLIRPASRAPDAVPGNAALTDLSESNASKGALTWRTAAAVAIPTGLVAGLLGVGGGTVAVPLQRRLMGIPLRTAIANSAAVIIATSLVGAILKNYAYFQEKETFDGLFLSSILIPTAIVGSLIGSRLTHRLPVHVIRVLFGVVLAVVAVRLIRDAARPLMTGGA